MAVRPGDRVRVRGLIWDVLEADRAAGRTLIGLRCVEGDMTGLEWTVFLPPEQFESIDASLDPRRPVPLSLWRAMHRAHRLNELPFGSPTVAREAGRVRVEPYQMVPLMRALDMPRPRLLLADGVGLGKTIQAGLIAVELIARGRAHRILIVVPSGPLLSQWEQETRLRFGLKFTPITSAAELWGVRRAHELGANPFDAVTLCITALDFAKQDHVLEEMERSSWDLVIIDEAHHCVGFGPRVSQDNTDRRRLAEVLARRSDGLLLVTATPHDGHDAHFASLIALLDPSLVDGAGGFIGQAYRRHAIRRMKAHIRDPRTGAPLFRRRHVIPVKVDVLGPEHERVRDFHRALSAFVVPRLHRQRGAGDALAFVSLLKRSVSTVAACLETLRVVMDRLARHEAGEAETKAAVRERARALRAWRRRAASFGSLSAADEASQSILETEAMAEALRSQPDNEPERLIALGAAAEPRDPKLSAMILEVRLIRMRYDRTNILIYTEYTDSQIAAARALRAAPGIDGEILTIGGQDSDEARGAAAQLFAERDGLILVSTDSLAEGLNLHKYCFHLIHLDLPYNPNRLEQRNGRIDRYGQKHEPEIRYLYIPGTFEESLLLHLIAKYEKARSSLDVMPNTLGVTAGPDDYQATLTRGLAEDPGDLFRTGATAIRSLDRVVADTSPETVAELMREIDRAFDAFDLMAVNHGWYGPRESDSGMETPVPPTKDADDLPDFIAAVVQAETNNPAIVGDTLRLPDRWMYGLDGLPGIDTDNHLIRFTRDPEAWRDRSGNGVAFFGRAHPLVLRAIRHGLALGGAVAVGRGDGFAIVLTYEMEIAVANRAVFRRIAVIMARPDGSLADIGDGLPPAVTDFATLPAEFVWDRWFAIWAQPALPRAALFADGIARQCHQAFAERHAQHARELMSQSHRWLRGRADLLCGAFVPRTVDLFGGPEPGPVWRYQADPADRLVSLATDPETSAAKRREANDALTVFRAAAASGATPGTVTVRPIGMLMLVPSDAI